MSRMIEGADLTWSSGGNDTEDFGFVSENEYIAGFAFDVRTTGPVNGGPGNPETAISNLKIERGSETLLECSGAELTQLCKALNNDTPSNTGAGVSPAKYAAFLPLVLNGNRNRIKTTINWAIDAGSTAGRLKVELVLEPGKAAKERIFVREQDIVPSSQPTPIRGVVTHYVLFQSGGLDDTDKIRVQHNAVAVIDDVEVATLVGFEEAHNITRTAETLIVYVANPPLSGGIAANASTQLSMDNTDPTTVIYIFER